jgi:hypothetical protein
MKSINIKFILEEDEKYEKDSDQGSEKVKNLWHYWHSLGEQQLIDKEEHYRKLKNLRKGVIDISDYVQEDVSDELSFTSNETKIEDIGLSFHPLIPVISNGIIGDYNTKHITYNAKAINRENTNDIIKSLNSELKELTIKKLQGLFLAENPNPNEEQQKLFEESEEVQKAYTSNYRTTIEEWANHTINKEDSKFNMKHIERELLGAIIENEDPVVHVQYKDDIYYPELIDAANCFHLKSPNNTDYSEGMMFGWFEDSTLTGVLAKDAESLSEEDISKLESWGTDSYSGGFVINGLDNGLTGNVSGGRESAQNYLHFKKIEQGILPIDNNLIRRTTIYFLLPAKLKKIHFADGNMEIFDSNYKVTKKPKYVPGKPKKPQFLVSGEHEEIFYINELWKGEALSANNSKSYYMDEHVDDSLIWISIKRHDIQYSEDRYKYGVRIPVHGGKSNKLSITEMCAPKQISYNWIWNKNQQLLSQEIGKFLMVNQGAIPSESLDDSWREDSLVKWLTTGRDVSAVPVGTPSNHLGQPVANTSIGQVVDLTKTAEILEKAQLAAIFKRDCYEQIGLTPEFLYGNNSPNQTASSVAQGLQRTSSQIQHLYIRLHEVLRRLRNTMLETAQHIESQYPISRVSYTSIDGARTIFEASTSDFSLHKLDIYIESNLSDADTLERIKQTVITNNTLGANTLEMATVQNIKSLPSMFHELSKLEKKQEQKMAEERAFQEKMQKEKIDSAEKMRVMELESKKEMEEREHERHIAVAQIRALGQGSQEADTVSKEIIELQNANSKQKQIYDNLNYQQSLLELKGQDTLNNKDKTRLDEKIKMKTLAQRDRELDIREQEVRASNKRTKAID